MCFTSTWPHPTGYASLPPATTTDTDCSPKSLCPPSPFVARDVRDLPDLPENTMRGAIAWRRRRAWRAQPMSPAQVFSVPGRRTCDCGLGDRLGQSAVVNHNGRATLCRLDQQRKREKFEQLQGYMRNSKVICVHFCTRFLRPLQYCTAVLCCRSRCRMLRTILPGLVWFGLERDRSPPP